MAHAAIALGTLSGGGGSSTRWHQNYQAGADGRLCSETVGGDPVCFLIAGIPLDHPYHHRRNCRVGSIRRMRAVRWGVAGRIVWAWLLTIPLSAGSRRCLYPGRFLCPLNRSPISY